MHPGAGSGDCVHVSEIVGCAESGLDEQSAASRFLLRRAMPSIWKPPWAAGGRGAKATCGYIQGRGPRQTMRHTLCREVLRGDVDIKFMVSTLKQVTIGIEERALLTRKHRSHKLFEDWFYGQQLNRPYLMSWKEYGLREVLWWWR